MTSNPSKMPSDAVSGTSRNHCEACGSIPETNLLVGLPLPSVVLEKLGLPAVLLHPTPLLCGDCLGKGLQGEPIDLLDLVKIAPRSVKQSIHTYLAHEFEI